MTGSSGSQKPLALEARGKDFALVRIDDGGNRSEMLLSEDNVIMLAQSARLIVDQLLAQRSRPGADPVLLMPVVQVGLNTDLHKSAIHLTMIDHRGNEIGFLLPPEVARPLAERLPVRLAEIEKAKPTKQ
jgi:hypothetical protein